jgi:hypothetical protein
VFQRRVLSGDSLPLSNPVFTLGATVTREAFAWSVDGASEEGVFSLPAWAARNYNTGTANPIRPTSITTPFPEALIIHFYFQRSATNAPDPSGYTQDEEIIISGTLVGNASSKTVADQGTVLANQDASPTSGVRWVAGIIAIPSADYPYYRSASQATATATSVTPALPSGTTDTDVLGNKDVLIATVEGAGSTTLSMTDGAWTEIATWDTTMSGGGSTVSKFWAYASGTLNRQANRTGSGEISAAICTYYNCHQAVPVGNTNVRLNASSTTSTWDALTRSATKVMVVITCIADGVPTFTAPSGWNERNDGLGITTADQVFNATGSTSSASFTLSTASPTAVGLVEIVGASSVVEHLRSLAIDANGAIVTAAVFFSIASSSGLLATSASISVSGTREVSRSTALDSSGTITVSGVASSPAETFERSVSLDAPTQVASSAVSFSVLSASVTVAVTAAVDSTGSFFSIAEGTASLAGAGTITSSALIEISRSLSIDVVTSIDADALFFSVLQGISAFDGTGAIASNGELESGTVTYERSVLIEASASVLSSATFLSIVQGAATCNCEAIISTDGQKEIGRSVLLIGIGTITVLSGLPLVGFRPTRFARVSKDMRIQSIGTENRVL